MTQPFVSIRSAEVDPEAFAAYLARVGPPAGGRPTSGPFPTCAPFRAGPAAAPDLADALPAARKAAGLTVAELAVRLGVPEETIGAIELGRLDAPEDYACAVLYHCGFDHTWRPPPGPERVTVGEQRCGACGHARALHAGGQGACLSGRAGSTEGGGCACGSFDGQGFEPRQGGVVEPLDLPPPAPLSEGAQPRRGPHATTLQIEADAAADRAAAAVAAAGGEVPAVLSPPVSGEGDTAWALEAPVATLCAEIDWFGARAAIAEAELIRRGKLHPEAVAAQVAAARAAPAGVADGHVSFRVTGGQAGGSAAATSAPVAPDTRANRGADLLAARLRVNKLRAVDLRMGHPTWAAIEGPKMRDRLYDRTAEWAIESTIDELLTAAVVRRDLRAEEAILELARRRAPFDATTSAPQPEVVVEVQRQVDVLRREYRGHDPGRPHMVIEDAEAAARLRAARQSHAPPPLDPVCPCQTDVEEPGPHLPTCPWSDPDYDPDLDRRVRVTARGRRAGRVQRVFPLAAGVNVVLLAPRELSFKDVVRLGTWLLSLAVD